MSENYHPYFDEHQLEMRLLYATGLEHELINDELSRIKQEKQRQNEERLAERQQAAEAPPTEVAPAASLPSITEVAP